jgi:hypothetical protein
MRSAFQTLFGLKNLGGKQTMLPPSSTYAERKGDHTGDSTSDCSPEQNYCPFLVCVGCLCLWERIARRHLVKEGKMGDGFSTIEYQQRLTPPFFVAIKRYLNKK